MKKPLLYAAVISVLSSCGRASCSNPPFQVNFSGFDSTELENVIINQYARGSNFSNLILRTELNLWTGSGGANVFNYGHEYIKWWDNGSDIEIIVSKAQKSWRINDVHFHNDHQNVGPGGVHDVCANGADYKLDGMGYSYDIAMGDEKSIFPIVFEFKK